MSPTFRSALVLAGVVGLLLGNSDNSLAYTFRNGLNLMHKVGIKGQGPQFSQPVAVCIVDMTAKRPPDYESKYSRAISDFYSSNFTPAANAWFRQIRGAVIYPTVTVQRGSMSFSYDLTGTGATLNQVPLLTGCASPSKTGRLYDAAVFLDWDNVLGFKSTIAITSRSAVGLQSSLLELAGFNVSTGFVVFRGEQLESNRKEEYVRALYHELGHLIAGLGDTYVENCGLAVKLYRASDGLLYPHPPAIMNWQSAIQLDDNLGAWAAWLSVLPVGTFNWDWLNDRVPELIAKMGLFKAKDRWEQDPARNLIGIWNLTGRLIDPDCN